MRERLIATRVISNWCALDNPFATVLRRLPSSGAFDCDAAEGDFRCAISHDGLGNTSLIVTLGANFGLPHQISRVPVRVEASGIHLAAHGWDTFFAIP